MKVTKTCRGGRRTGPGPLLLCAALLLSLAPALSTGCSDDDDDTPGPSSERTGGATGTGSGGSGGSGGVITGSGGTGVGFGGAGGGTTGAGGSGGTGASGDAADAGPAADGGDATGDAVAGLLTDGQVGGVALELNGGEVSVGALATTRAKAPAVKAFAAMMVTEHGATVARMTALLASAGIAPAPSPEREMVAATAASTMMVLSPLRDEAFDRAYVDSQIAMHMTALDLLNTKLIPSAQNAALKAELIMMQMAVTEHLTMARQLLP